MGVTAAAAVAAPAAEQQLEEHLQKKKMNLQLFWHQQEIKKLM